MPLLQEELPVPPTTQDSSDITIVKGKGKDILLNGSPLTIISQTFAITSTSSTTIQNSTTLSTTLALATQVMREVIRAKVGSHKVT